VGICGNGDQRDESKNHSPFIDDDEEALLKFSVVSTTSPTFDDLSVSRHNNFDCLRLLLAIVVLQYHSFPCSGQASHQFWTRLATFQFGGGWIAVNFFFAISGFLITSSWLRSSGLNDFLRKRFLRIYPGFIIAMLFCAFVIGPLTGARLPEYFHDARTFAYFKPLVLGPVESLPGVLQDVPWAGLVNGSIWTIRFEIFCYLFLAALGSFGLLKRRGVILVLFALALVTSSCLTNQWPRPVTWVVPYFGSLWELPRFLSYFLAGVSFFLWRDRIRFDLALLGIAGAFLFLGYVAHLESISLPICGSYLIFFAAFARQLPFQRVGARGDLSYGVYLYAFPVQQLLVYYLPIARHALVLTAMALPLTLALAVISWKVVEQPCLKLKKRAPSRPEASRAVPRSVAGARSLAVGGG
jgi:peptidoglycan/LPS O-acetylase OafA/YrhL